MRSSASESAPRGFPRAGEAQAGTTHRSVEVGPERPPAETERREKPRIVALGGGTGMAALLRGLKEYTDRITAVVTVTDNGGSSGLLRNDFDMVAPGDIRNCLLALADIDPLIARAFQYRFEEAEFRGHSFGNLFITVLTRLVGDFGASIGELNRLLNVRGRVIPATSARVSLVAQHPDGSKSTGEVQITRSQKEIQKVELRPAPVPVSPEILQAVQEADLFLFGPGSLYTSVLPNLLFAGMVESINATGKPRVYICNIMTQPGETDGYSLADHIRALRVHVGADFPDAVVAHDGGVPEQVLEKYRAHGAEPVACDIQGLEEFRSVRLITGNFFSEGDGPPGEEAGGVAAGTKPACGTARHDSAVLARVIYDGFLQPLEEASRGDVGRSAETSTSSGASGPANESRSLQNAGEPATLRVHETRALG